MDSPASSPLSGLEDVPVRRAVPLAGLTSLRIGGPAALLLEPRTPEDLARALDHLTAAGLPWRILGGGANTLAPDGGVAGAVVHTGALRRVYREGHRLRLWPGVTLPALVRGAWQHGLAGLELLAGVPGHMGGGLAMNAGSADWGLWDVTEEVYLWLPPEQRGGGPALVRRSREEVGPRYRDGNLRGAVVLEAVLALREDRREAVRRRMEAHLRRKNRTQPVSLSSAGCAFRNPPGDSAGRLLDAAGLKGSREGAAVVSSRHANFVINEGGATAAQVRRLLARMAAAVAERFAVRLEPELVIWPEPDREVQESAGSSRQG